MSTSIDVIHECSVASTIIISETSQSHLYTFDYKTRYKHVSTFNTDFGYVILFAFN